jgi:hypothetical protein
MAKKRKKTRTPNPLIKRAPPQFVSGQVGGEQVWRYAGVEIDVHPPRTRIGVMSLWRASFVSPDPADEGEETSVRAIDRDAALANARHQIDLHELGEAWRDAEYTIHHVLDNYVDTTNDPINRARLARHLEVWAQTKHFDPTYPVKARDFQAFYALPLQDRLALLDAVIDFQERAEQFEPQRRIPEEKPKMKEKSKNPHYEEYTVSELERMPTIISGHMEDLKHDDGKVRYWLSRMSAEDGEEYAIYVEELQNGRWVDVHQYGDVQAYDAMYKKTKSNVSQLKNKLLK